MRSYVLLVAVVASAHALTADNWAHTVEFEFQDYVQPTNEPEIQQIVQAATQTRTNVRVIGAGHSFMPVMETDGVLINLDNYNRTIAIAETTATFESGIRIRDLIQRLDDVGKTLPNIAWIMDQSLGGVLGTNTMGTGHQQGGYSSMLVEMRIVTNNGVIVTASEQQNVNVFHACGVAFGTCGVITEVTVRIEDQFYMNRGRVFMTYGEAASRLPEFFDTYEHFAFSAAVVPTSPPATWGVQLTTWTRTPSTIVAPLPDGCFTGADGSYPIDCSDKMYRAVVGQPNASNSPPVGNAPGGIGGYVVIECFLPFDSMQQFMIDWQNIMTNEISEEVGLLASHSLAHRFGAADSNWLSQAYETGVMTLDVTLVATPLSAASQAAMETYTRRVSALTLEHRGRVHWGKNSALTGPEFRESHPRMADFLAQRALLDPLGIFLNCFTREVFFDVPCTDVAWYYGGAYKSLLA